MLKRKKPTLSRRHKGNAPRADLTINFPIWMLDHIHKVAADCGIPREDVIKVWVAEKVLSREKLSTRPVRYDR